MDNNSYSVNMSCTNCDWSGSINLSKGQPTMFAVCPKCGCSSLTKKGVFYGLDNSTYNF